MPKQLKRFSAQSLWDSIVRCTPLLSIWALTLFVPGICHSHSPDNDVWIAAPGHVAAAPVQAKQYLTARSSGRPMWRQRGSSRTVEIGPSMAPQQAPLPPLANGDVYADSAYVLDLDRAQVLYAKNAEQVRPIASISKLMSALIVLESGQPLDEDITITAVDASLPVSSRLTIGTQLSRNDLLHLALMSSENRAIQALARSHPGGLSAFVAAMNSKAKQLKMSDSHFADPTGLSSDNVSSPHDLVTLMLAAEQEQLIRRYTTDDTLNVRTSTGMQPYHNTNALVGNPDWAVTLSKTGYTNAAGRSLVMLTRVDGRRTAFVILGSANEQARLRDSQRLRRFADTAAAKTISSQ